MFKKEDKKKRKNLHVTTAFILKLTNDQLKIDKEKARKRNCRLHKNR